MCLGLEDWYDNRKGITSRRGGCTSRGQGSRFTSMHQALCLYAHDPDPAYNPGPYYGRILNFHLSLQRERLRAESQKRKRLTN